VNLDDFQKYSRPDVARLASDGLLSDALFYADDFACGNGFVLIFSAATVQGNERGILYKQDGLPRLFFTPLALMDNARALGIEQYSVDATKWRAEAYSPYKAQVRWRKQQEGSGDD